MGTRPVIDGNLPVETRNLLYQKYDRELYLQELLCEVELTKKELAEIDTALQRLKTPKEVEITKLTIGEILEVEQRR
ncbi:hypothetical protein MSKOL_1626 [Methanosarcina sp. Kolksee]|uniref:hypothetical protein n=1 Tax=Methanosarcina sp. Kolksee TaxID=1434099 RepID=UPI000615A0C4|nr:hypothetical protein [Methanosarcina sp. Kolksee]AKB47403.1 hypothetical protein MSKOL_1626 [Methanosarcina sp. Kolksee]